MIVLNFLAYENKKIHSLRPFARKKSLWRNPDQELRTNQNTRIYLKATLPYNKYVLLNWCEVRIWELSVEWFFYRFTDRAAGEVQKLAIKERDQNFRILTKQARSISIYYNCSF